MIRLFQFSKFGLIVAVTYVLLLISFRLTLPFGDEPDFTVRAFELTKREWPIWTLYSWVPGLLGSLETTSACKIEAGVFTLVAYIDHTSCSQDTGQLLLRSVLTLLVVYPLMMFIAWRRLGIEILRRFVNEQPKELNARLDALSLSLLVPGMIYYLSLLSHEQLTLVISLFIFPFWGNLVVVFTLVAMVASLDAGNAAVVAGFIVIHQILSRLIKRVGAKFTIIIALVSLALINLLPNELMAYIGYISILEDRVEAISSLDGSLENIREKYPVILRSFIAFMTFFLGTPAGVKVIPVYILAFVAVAIGGLRIRHQYKMAVVYIGQYDSTRLVLAASALYTIFFFTFLLPGYANGKYYIFLMPFFVYLFLEIFSKWSIYCLLACSSALVPLALILYRL